MTIGKNDVATAAPGAFNWDSSDPAKSLRGLRDFVESEAQNAINWYWKAKRGKKFPSFFIQFLVLMLTAFAGLAPIIVQIMKNSDPNHLYMKGFDSGPIASLFVGLAAMLLGLDKTFGYSSGWTRYTLTATSMTKVWQEFRIDWLALYAAAAEPPTSEQQAAVIQRVKEFVSAIQAALLQETKDWATEFQSNSSQMEKDVKSQLDTLKAQVDKVAKANDDASRPGALELTVTNADKTEAFQFEVVLEGKTARTDAISNSKVWAQIDLPPGTYKATINGKANGKPVSTSMTLEIRPAETCRVSATLPIA